MRSGAVPRVLDAVCNQQRSDLKLGVFEIPEQRLERAAASRRR
jgi:hypothetical protein